MRRDAAGPLGIYCEPCDCMLGFARELCRARRLPAGHPWGAETARKRKPEIEGRRDRAACLPDHVCASRDTSTYSAARLRVRFCGDRRDAAGITVNRTLDWWITPSIAS